MSVAPEPLPHITVDIVSDVVCPWCIIGYKKLEQAMERLSDRAEFSVAWHAFELNPWMPPEGQDIATHMRMKYGVSPEQSKGNRDRLRSAGEGLGFTFANHPDMRMVNTFDAHRLLTWAGSLGGERQTALKLALFTAHFTDGRNVSDHETLIAIAQETGLDAETARGILASDDFADDVRAEEAQWEDRFISGVPAFIFNGKYMVPGAQDPDVLVQVIERKLLS